jgi:peptide/nickel transport system substrate-binding protein
MEVSMAILGQSRPRRRSFVAVAALGVVAILGAPLGAALAESPSPANGSPIAGTGNITLRIGTSQKWSTLNPFLALLGNDNQITSINYDLLTEIGPDLKPAPGLAESWTHSDDGLTWTFKIRQGAVWQDGQPVTAADVAFTYNYIHDSFSYKDGSFGLGLFRDNLVGVTSITAPDAQTVILKMDKPAVTILSAAIPILPQHIWKDVTYEAASGASKDVAPFDNASMVGSGPFHLVQEVKDQYVRFAANKQFWGGAPKIDQLIIQYFPDPGPMVEALKNGQIDMIDSVPTTEFAALSATPGIATVRGTPIAFYELGMNSWIPQEGQTKSIATEGSRGNPWLTRVDVRQALFHAVNKASIVKTALLDNALPGDSILPPGYPYHWSPSPTELIDFDPAKTRSMLEVLGFKDTDSNGVLNVPASQTSFDPKGAGKDLVLRLYIRKGHPEELTAGQIIQDGFKQGGVGVNLQVVEESPFLANSTFPSATNADSDLYLWGWSGGYGPEPDFTLGRVATSSQINAWQDANYSNPDFDALYAQQHAQLDPAQRSATVQQMQKLFYTAGSYAVLWYPYRLQAYRSDRWQGIKTFPPDGGAVFSLIAYGPNNTLLTTEPKSAAGSATTPTNTTSPSGGAATIVVVGLIIFLVAIAGAFLLYRRRSRPELGD